jgi:hypothetical protein
MDWVLVLFVMMGFGRSAEGDPSLIELKEALWPEEGLSSWSDIISTLNGVLTVIFMNIFKGIKLKAYRKVKSRTYRSISNTSTKSNKKTITATGITDHRLTITE